MKTSIFSTTLNSNFFWLFFALLLTEGLVSYFHPLKFVHVEGTVLKDHDFVGCKVNQLLKNSKDTNAIVLGDSTGDGICVYPDMVKLNLPLTSYSWYYYCDAKYASSILKQKLNLPISIKNLSYSGSLMSDQTLLCNKLIEFGAKPKLAIITLVPRPFLDTTVDPKLSPVKNYFDNRFKNLSDTKNFKELFENFFIANSSIYRTRSDYATVLFSLSCNTLNRPLNSYQKAAGITQKNKVCISGSEEKIDPSICSAKELINRDISHYKNAYKFDPRVFDYQYQQFEDMLGLLNKNKIQIVLVKLPLSKANLDLLPEEYKACFDQKLEHSAAYNQAKLIDLQKDSRFDADDFVDSVHLNAAGSLKLWDILSESIQQDTFFLKRFKLSFEEQTPKPVNRANYDSKLSFERR